MEQEIVTFPWSKLDSLVFLIGNQHLLEVVAIYFYFLMELGACMSR